MDSSKFEQQQNELFIRFLFWSIAGGDPRHFYREMNMYR